MFGKFQDIDFIGIDEEEQRRRSDAFFHSVVQTEETSGSVYYSTSLTENSCEIKRYSQANSDDEEF